MLCHMVAVDPAPVVDLDDLQPVLEMLLQAHTAVVHMVENTEFYVFSFKPDGPRVRQSEDLKDPGITSVGNRRKLVAREVDLVISARQRSFEREARPARWSGLVIFAPPDASRNQ